jgi:outer membrane biosynthesis protein TonB
MTGSGNRPPPPPPTPQPTPPPHPHAKNPPSHYPRPRTTRKPTEPPSNHQAKNQARNSNEAPERRNSPARSTTELRQKNQAQNQAQNSGSLSQPLVTTRSNQRRFERSSHRGVRGSAPEQNNEMPHGPRVRRAWGTQAARGGGGNRTRVLRRFGRASPGAACVAFYSAPALPQAHR